MHVYTYNLWGMFYLARHDHQFRMMETSFRRMLGLRAQPWNNQHGWVRSYTTMFYPSKRRRS